jgi:hypothetical protein
MGYRSDVGYKIKFDKDVPWAKDIPVSDALPTSKDLFNLFVAEAKAKDETKLCFDDDDGAFEIDDENLSITFLLNGSKSK